MTKFLLSLSIILSLSAFIISVVSFASAAEYRRGCCSHHLGVCGCDQKTGHQLCCDGAISPTCLCGE